MDTLISVTPEQYINDTMVSLEFARFNIGKKVLTIRKFQSVSTIRRDPNTAHYFSDKYGHIETVFLKTKGANLRTRLKSVPFFTDAELKQLQTELREHDIYIK